jgi:hypothetical protein
MSRMPALPPEFRQIHLELAREPGHPEGSRATGYDLVAPLDADNRLSPELFHQYREHCRVHRFREGEDDMIGRLARKPGGAWYFDYDTDIESDDEDAFRLGSEQFTVGEYISVRDEHGRMHTYRIVSVRPL